MVPSTGRVSSTVTEGRPPMNPSGTYPEPAVRRSSARRAASPFVPMIRVRNERLPATLSRLCCHLHARRVISSALSANTSVSPTHALETPAWAQNRPTVSKTTPMAVAAMVDLNSSGGEIRCAE
jgi:hypothetical protein